MTRVDAQQVQVTPRSGALTARLQPIQGTLISKSTLVVAGTTNLNLGREVIVTSVVGPTTTLRCEAHGPPPPGSHGGWSAAAGWFAVDYAASAPVAGVLRLTLAPQCLMNPPYIDVGDDGTFEIVMTAGTVDVPVVLGVLPLVVSINNETVNFAPGVCLGTASVEFVPTPTQLTVIGAPCGPELTADLVPRPAAASELEVRAGNSTGLVGVFVFGTQPRSWPFSCPLYTDIAASAPVVPANGSAALDVMIPSVINGVVLVQYVEASPAPVVVGTSNAIRVTFP